jgi:chromosome partitioning protein
MLLMKTIGMLSRKGGSGKTTLAVHLAVLAQQANCRTLLIDLDPQHSAADWWRAREADTPQLVETDPGSLRDVLEAARTDGVELVMVDTRPSAERDAVLVAGLSDLILVPTRPAILDLRAILGTVDVIKGAARRSLIVLNACPPPRGARGGHPDRGCPPRGGRLRRAGGSGADRQPDDVRQLVADRSDGRRDGTRRQGRQGDARVVARGGKELTHEKAHARDRIGEEDAPSDGARAAADG